MKSTWVDHDGNVRCPKCGGKQFTSKRTGKAKWAGVLTVGVGVLAMPKRLKCQGCGQNLKTGSAKDSEWNRTANHEAVELEEVVDPAPDVPVRLSRGAVRESGSKYTNITEVKMRSDAVRVGDYLRWADRSGMVVGIEPDRWGNLSIQLDDGKKAVGLAPMSKVKIKRREL